MLRVILDTNVLINGIQDEMSYTNRIVDLCLQGEIQPIASKAILRENKRLAKRLIQDREYIDKLDEFYGAIEEVRVTTTLHIVEDDPEDDKFFACGIDGKADYIITDDYHLLDIGEYQGIKVKTPEAFWNIHQGNSGQGEEWKSWAQSIGIGV